MTKMAILPMLIIYEKLDCHFVTGTDPVPTRILVLYFENDGNSHAITMCEVQVFSDPGIENFCTS